MRAHTPSRSTCGVQSIRGFQISLEIDRALDTHTPAYSYRCICFESFHGAQHGTHSTALTFQISGASKRLARNPHRHSSPNRLFASMLLVGQRIFAIVQLAFRLFDFDGMGSQDHPIATRAARIASHHSVQHVSAGPAA
jgi:hypothetical protein